MAYGERCALVGLLQGLKPRCAIEIGTNDGGSTIAVSQFAEKVWSLDIERKHSTDLERNLTNVEFITGPSRETLPALLRRIEREGDLLEFVLIDGDHSTEGAKTDVENVLRFQPAKPLFVLMHDSFNPDARRGIREVDWSANAYMRSQCCPGKVAPSDGKSRPLNVLWPVLPGNDLKSRGRKWSPERSIRTRHNEG